MKVKFKKMLSSNLAKTSRNLFQLSHAPITGGLPILPVGLSNTSRLDAHVGIYRLLMKGQNLWGR
jgi:hypothetical protein